jgi:hypothetical protein
MYQPDLEGLVGGSWVRRALLPEGRYGMGIAGLVDALYIVGGKTNSATPSESLRYMPQSDNFQSFELPEHPVLNGVALVPFDTQLYALGGRTANGFEAAAQSYQAIYTIMLPEVH